MKITHRKEMPILVFNTATSRSTNTYTFLCCWVLGAGRVFLFLPNVIGYYYSIIPLAGTALATETCVACWTYIIIIPIIYAQHATHVY